MHNGEKTSVTICRIRIDRFTNNAYFYVNQLTDQPENGEQIARAEQICTLLYFGGEERDREQEREKKKFNEREKKRDKGTSNTIYVCVCVEREKKSIGNTELNKYL